jgi:hypothetical protein
MSLLRPNRSESESYVTTDGQSASLSWNKTSVWGLRPDSYYCQTVAGLLMWGTLSVERMGLSFTIAAGPRQRSPHGILNRPSLHGSLYRLPVTMENVCCHGNVLTGPLASNGHLFIAAERVFGEPLVSNGLSLWLRCSGFQASCHSVYPMITL